MQRSYGRQDVKQPMTDFETLIGILVNQHVEFIIVGGVAATAHGSSKLTQDLDIVYCRSTENIDRLTTALEPHKPYLRGAPPGLPFRFNRETVQRGLNFTLMTDVGALDVFGEITGGGGYNDLLPHSINLKLFGFTCYCLDLKRLIEVKRAAGRPRDLEVVAELEALAEEQQLNTQDDHC